MKQAERTARSKNEIFAAAHAEFGQHDYGTVTMESICTKHHISKGMMYHYYTGKDDLFLLCVQSMFEQLYTYLKSHFAAFTQGSVSDMVNGYFLHRERFFQTFTQERMIYENAMLRPPKHLKAEIQKLRQPVRKINRRFMEQVFTQIALRESVRQEDAMRYLESISCLCWPLWDLYRDEEEGADVFGAEKEFRHFLNMVLFGVAREDIGANQKP